MPPGVAKSIHEITQDPVLEAGLIGGAGLHDTEFTAPDPLPRIDVSDLVLLAGDEESTEAEVPFELLPAVEIEISTPPAVEGPPAVPPRYKDARDLDVDALHLTMPVLPIEFRSAIQPAATQLIPRPRVVLTPEAPEVWLTPGHLVAKVVVLAIGAVLMLLLAGAVLFGRMTAPKSGAISSLSDAAR